MAKRIEEITVENVKGISSKTFTFSDFYVNKLNILVAPNGFGKTSISTCFDSLKPRSLTLDESDFHNGQSSLVPKLIVKINLGDTITTFEANQTKNDLHGFFKTSVVKSRIFSRTRQAPANMRASSHIAHKELVLVDSVPTNISLNYQKTTFNFVFTGPLRPKVKHLKNELLNNERFLLWFIKSQELNKLEQVRTQTKLTNIQSNLTNCETVASSILSGVEQHNYAKEICDRLKETFSIDSNIELLITFFQLVTLYRSSKDNVLDSFKYILYSKWKTKVSNLVQALDTANRNAATIHQFQGKLYFKISNINDISNGQRDVMSFVAQLYKAEYSLLYESKKDYSILVVDELFDYLDDATLLACKYFLSKFILDFKYFSKNIFPMLLTHLAPKEFNSYRFGKTKHHFLQPRSSGFVNNDIRKIVNARNDLSYTDQIRDDISKYYLHYHDQIHSPVPSVGMNNQITSSLVFYNIVKTELQNYINGGNTYDPISICTGIRIIIEEHVFDSLAPAHKQGFLSVHKTFNKLDYSLGHGVEIPEIFYMLGIIFNEAVHAKNSQFKFIEEKISSQLENVTIKKLVTEVSDVCS